MQWNKLNQTTKKHVYMLIAVILISLWSTIQPYDWFLWIWNFVVAWVYLGGFLLTYKKFKFTTFSYVFLFIHLIVILVAAKYTYENTPLFNTIRDLVGQDRNNYDRLGHLLQGFIPALLTRELFISTNTIQRGKMGSFIVIMFTLAISALWELGEFIGAVWFHKTDAYLISSQGDIWDAQWDMFLALIGALLAVTLLGVTQDKYMKKKN